jgi:tetratricopeptide (TPR) repeat protein
MVDVANVYRGLGHYEKAEDILLRAFDVQKRVLGEEHPETLSCLFTLARVTANLGRLDEAEGLYLRVLDLRRRVLGEQHLKTLATMNNLAGLYLAWGQPEKAEPLARAAMETYRTIFGEQNNYTIMAADTYGMALLGMGLAAEAEPLLRNLLARLNVTEWSLPILQAHHGLCLGELGRYEEAERLLIEAYPQLHAIQDEQENMVRYTVQLYEAWGKPEQADKWRARLPAAQGATASD